MKKEDVKLIAQLLTSMKDLLLKLEESERKKDKIVFDTTKRRILQFQSEINRLL